MRLAVRATAFWAIASCAAVSLSGAWVTACGGAKFSAAPDDAAATNPDTAPPPGVDAGRFCQREGSAHGFCDDFDGPPLSASWNINAIKGATQPDSTLSVSPPNSFEGVAQSSTTGNVLGTTNQGRISKGFAVSSRVDVAFDLHVDTTPAQPDSGIYGDSIVSISLGTDYSVGLDANTTSVGYFEDLVTDAGSLRLSAAPLTPTAAIANTWEHIEVAVDIPGKTLTLTLNGEAKTLPISPPSGLAPTLYLGPFSHNMPGQLEVHFDDVTVDVTP